MPRAASPAADAAMPEISAPEPAPDTQPEPPAETGFWRYVGWVQRLYMHIPVTVDHEDVIAHAGPPSADGHWEPHPGPATRQPDNAPAVEQPADPAPAERATTGTGEE